MSTRSRFQAEIDQIESIAETKGIDIDTINVRESQTDEGEELIVFRVLETEGDSEEDSVGVQITKMPSVQTGEMTFRNDVQKKISALKQHLSSEQASDDGETVEDDDAATESDTTRDASRGRTRQTSRGDGPGAEIDARLTEIENRLDDLESTVAEIEDKSEALDGLQKLIGDDDGE